jgi:PleD family two-component response regulator
MILFHGYPFSRRAHRAHTLERSSAPAPVSILVIDDEESVRDLIRAILEPVGYTIVKLRTAERACAAFVSRPRTP